jgi:molybdate transport system substrate-binding protein
MNSFQAADLQVIAGVGMTHALNEIAVAFESTTGRKIAFRFGTTPELIRLATSGDPFDLGIVPRDVLQDTAARAQFAPAATRDVARVGIGVAVRRGGARRDIGTLKALKQALLAAQSVASIPASATGTQLADVYERLGITEAMNARTKAQPGPSQLVEAVASGDAELAVFLLNVLAHPRLDVIGPFPPEVQREVVYTAGVAVDAREPEAAMAFIAYLRTPPAAKVIKSNGLTPG